MFYPRIASLAALTIVAITLMTIRPADAQVGPPGPTGGGSCQPVVPSTTDFKSRWSPMAYADWLSRLAAINTRAWRVQTPWGYQAQNALRPVIK